jgi:hypothetical protein
MMTNRALAPAPLLAMAVIVSFVLVGACYASTDRAPDHPGAGALTDRFEVTFQAWNALYKQALVGTNRPDARADTLLSLTNDALTAWLVVLDRFYESPPSVYAADAYWQRDLATVTGYLEIARRQLASGRVTQAHRALGPVRSVLLDLRRRNGIAYYGDVLFEYHNAMEAACDPVIADPSSVTQAALPGIAGRVRDARAAWQHVLDFNFSPVDESGRQKHRELIAAESRALLQLETAVTSGDAASITVAAQEVKAHYRTLYLAFG